MPRLGAKVTTDSISRATSGFFYKITGMNIQINVCIVIFNLWQPIVRKNRPLDSSISESAGHNDFETNTSELVLASNFFTLSPFKDRLFVLLKAQHWDFILTSF